MVVFAGDGVVELVKTVTGTSIPAAGALLGVGIVVGKLISGQSALETTLKESRTEARADFGKLETAIKESRTEALADFGKLETSIKELRTEARADFGKLETSVETAIKELRTELRGDMAAQNATVAALANQAIAALANNNAVPRPSTRSPQPPADQQQVCEGW